MALDRLTKITGPGVATDTNWVGNNANFTGVTTTGSSFNVGVSTFHSTLAEVHNIKSTGIITATGGSFSGNVTAVDGTFSGNVSIAGTLTYEDVTNIDSVGIITAPALDVDDFISVGSNIHLGNAGVITATSFVGSGAALTGIDATAIKDSGGNVKVQAQASGAVYTGIHTFNSDIDVDGHTNLDNVSVAGVSTFSDNIHLLDNDYLYIGGSAGTTDGIRIYHNGNNSFVRNTNKTFYIGQESSSSEFPLYLQAGNEFYLKHFAGNGGQGTVIKSVRSGAFTLYHGAGNVPASGTERLVTTSTGINFPRDIDVDGHTNLDNVSIAGVTTITGTLGSSDITITSNQPKLSLTDSSNNPDWSVKNANGNFAINDETAGATRFSINSSNGVEFHMHAVPSVDSTYDLGLTGTRWRNVYADTLYGDGSNLSGITQTTINNNADNRVITGSGTANTLEGESNLTFSGSTLKVNSTTGHSYLKINSNDSYSGSIHFGDQSDDDAAQIWYDNYQGNGMYLRTSENTPMSFYTNGTQRLRIHSGGQISSGVNSNSYELTIGGLSGGPTLWLRDSTTSGTSRLMFGSSAGALDGAIYYKTDSNYMAFYTNGTEHIRIDQSGNLNPYSDASRDLGTSSLRWRNVYTTDLQLSNENTGGNEVDGTEGNWTLQEGESDVYMINRKTGKKYKMMLQEVS